MQHERGPRTSTIRKQVALYFRGHKEENGAAAHFPSAALPAPAFFTTVTQLEPHGLELATVSATPERQTLVSLAQPTPKVSGLLGSRSPVLSRGCRWGQPFLLSWDGVRQKMERPLRVLGQALQGALGISFFPVETGMLKLCCAAKSVSKLWTPGPIPQRAPFSKFEVEPWT